jgi:hypothetical protein
MDFSPNETCLYFQLIKSEKKKSLKKKIYSQMKPILSHIRYEERMVFTIYKVIFLSDGIFISMAIYYFILTMKRAFKIYGRCIMTMNYQIFAH